MNKRSLISGAFLALLCLVLPLHAYVTSAILEYSADDKASFYLNGHVLLSPQQAEDTPTFFACLSTSDGSIPLSLFNNNGDNVLASEYLDKFGGAQDISYRLTVHQSNGDPVVIWSEPGQNTKFLWLLAGQPDPAGWTNPKFDDSSWVAARQMVWSYALPRLPDNHFDAFLGGRGYVPVLAYRSDGLGTAHARGLFRNHFAFPNALAKATLLMNPTKANAGQAVALRLIPGRDVADLGDVRLHVHLPAGLRPTKLDAKGSYDARTGTLNWTIGNATAAAQYAKLPAQSIISASGWKRPQMALGPFRPQYMNFTPIINPSVRDNAAAWFLPSLPGWFRLASSGINDGQGAPQILGVIFKLQAQAGGTNTQAEDRVNHIFMNYSFDDSLKPALKQDVQVTHSAGPAWSTAYYDATEDRVWTWSLINNLHVKVVAQQATDRQWEGLASCVATVRYFPMENFAPAFYATVSETQCKELDVKVDVEDPRNHTTVEDSYPLMVNQYRCAPPTPLPTIAVIPTPQPGAAPALPRPTAVPTASLLAAVNFGPGCLSSAPEPFKRGGAFIYFCLKREADVSLQIYDSQGKLLRDMAPVHFRAAEKNELFFNALDSQGNLLPPGKYEYQLTAHDKGAAATWHANFSHVKD